MSGDGGDRYGICASCGAEDWQVERRGLWERTWAWFTFGRSAGRSERVVCRRCGAPSTSFAMALMRPRRQHWWGAPWRAVQVLRRARHSEPVPRTYVLAGAVAAVVAAVGMAVVGWPWWSLLVGAGVAVAVTWLLFLSTARGSHVERLRRDLLAAFSLRRAQQRRDADERRLLERPPFPLFGLGSSWTGSRSLGGMSSGWTRGRPEETGIQSITLTHGDPRQESGPLVRITMSKRPPIPGEVRRRYELERDRPPPGASEEEFSAWARSRMLGINDPTPGDQVHIRVDGKLTDFDRYGDDAWWTAEGKVGKLTLILEVRAIPPAALEVAPITDPGPYLEGLRGV